MAVILIIFSRVLLLSPSLHLLSHTHTHAHTLSKKGTFIPDYFLFFTQHHHSLAKKNRTTETETKAEAKTKTTKEKTTTKAS